MLREITQSRLPDDVAPGTRSHSTRGATREVATLPLPTLGRAALGTLLAQLPVGVVLANREGRIAYANEAACRLRAAGLVPVQRRRRADGPVAWAIDLAIARALLTGEVVRDEEVEFIGSDDRRHWVRIRASAVREPSGAIESAVITVADATAERHEAAWAPVIESLARL